MVRLPAGWGSAFHYPASTGPGRGLAARRATPVPVEFYRNTAAGVPLQPAQGQAVVAGGGATVTLGPTGLGTVWFPTQVTVSTTTGVLDTSTFQLYLGPVGVPITLVGTLFPGGAGTIALAIPQLTPGQYLIGVWTDAHDGDLAAMNVVGTMNALTT